LFLLKKIKDEIEYKLYKAIAKTEVWKRHGQSC